jgi:excisionase family DNA binding protein
MSDWLSLSAAAELLGVHPSTVRLWSDKGMLPVHRTKGGHRRYKRDEVMLWAQTAREVRTIQPEDMMQSAVRNVRIQVTEGRLEAESWYQKLDEEARTQYRQSSRSLFQGLMNFLASTNEDADSEAFAVGYEYASRARRYNLSYVDATRAFMFFRNVLIESVMKVYSEANIPSGKAWEEMLGKMHTFTDQILISLLDTFQALETNSNGKS